ncbi:hypothetical protein GCM10022224_046750 [Nonomuraea antimicrobica]|uniref:Lecithin retinol acyltransferase n=1 Tax=Nonomuraea antimicrobica TaxID=561173 RepID=A0ABP7C4T5_9ACTN
MKITVKRAVVALCALVTAGSATASVGSPAYALGPGRVCMFLSLTGVPVLGHVGWAFRIDDSPQWIFGSTDSNEAGDRHVPKGAFNGAWWRRGTFDTVKSVFRTNRIDYTRYRCKDTPTSAVGAAAALAKDAKKWGYDLFENNCLDHAAKILNTYRGAVAPAPWSYPVPSEYFAVGLKRSGWEPARQL